MAAAAAATETDAHSDLEPTMAKPSAGLLHRALFQIGLIHLHRAPSDIKLLIVQRYVRVTAYGAMALILVAYLRLIGITEARIGYFMTATLLGDVAVSMLLAAYGDWIGRRRVLIIGCSLMSISGLVFAFSENYWILLAAAVFGVITPSGSDLGPFRIIEESTISHLTHYKDRPTMYGWYVMAGRFGAGSGMLFCGLVTHSLIEDRHWDTIQCYRAAFVFYAVAGVVKVTFTLALSSRCDETRIIKADPSKPTGTSSYSTVNASAESETAPLLGESYVRTGEESERKEWLHRTILPTISHESRKICMLMCFFVSFEYVGNAMASLSWLAYYFQKIFDMSEESTGLIFFTSQICGGIFAVIGSAVARRIGNLPTLFGVAIIANAGFVVLGLVTSKAAAVAAVIIRDSIQQAEGGAVMSFSVELFLPSERTAALGLLSVFKTLASSIGPTFTGLLVESDHYWVVFIIAACVKTFYASGLLLSFAKHKSPERREAEAAAAAAAAEAEVPGPEPATR